MLSSLKRRAARAGLLERVDTRLAAADTLGIKDLAGSIDFTLAYALVHELPAAEPFFAELAAASKPGAGLLFAEPGGHVKPPAFETELNAAIHAGFDLVERPKLRRSQAAFLKKT
jgi:SAM-dependent methyltransferase